MLLSYSMERRRILIVDDEPWIRKLLTTVFTKAGYDVRAAEGGSEAMAMCIAEHFDAILSEVMMPGMDGHELARWVARHQPDTPSILMSGFDPFGCESCGMSQPCLLLPKPFSPKQAIATVEEALSHRG
jgi:two-component system, cell cycle response regulator CpdR